MVKDSFNVEHGLKYTIIFAWINRMPNFILRYAIFNMLYSFYIKIKFQQPCLSQNLICTGPSGSSLYLMTVIKNTVLTILENIMPEICLRQWVSLFLV